MMTTESISISCACGRTGCFFVKTRKDQRFKGNSCRIFHCRQKKKLLSLIGASLKSSDDIFNALTLYAPLIGFGEEELSLSSHSQ